MIQIRVVRITAKLQVGNLRVVRLLREQLQVLQLV